MDSLMLDALYLIKELTEENESLKQSLDHEHASFMETFGEYGERCERLSEENERLQVSCTELTRCCTKLETLYKIACKRADTAKANNLSEIKTRFALRYGTYTDKDMTPIKEVFRLIDQIAKETEEGENVI